MDAVTAPTVAHAAEPDAEMAARLRLSVMRVARLLRVHSGDEVSASQLSALSTLDRHGPTTLGELSANERVKPPTMTRVVASLEEMGLVTRTTDQRDRRVARVAITDAGRELLARTRSSKDAFLAARLSTLPDADRRALARAADALDRLLDGS
jgi:DNA-binding MarR family transcriptional regulator